MFSRYDRRVNTPLFLTIAWLVLAPWAAGQEAPARRAKAEPPTRTNRREPAASPPNQPTGAAATRQAQPARCARIGKFVPQPRKPRAPWELDEQQQATLDLVLAAWEKKSAIIKTLTCNFTMWEYDFIFDNGGLPAGQAPHATRVNRGEIKYAAPDRGVYHIIQQVGKNGKFEDREGAYWVCDGQAVYEFNHEQKRLYERRLPNELKGSAISNGPLPFLFGATAEQMRSRYWLRVSTEPGAIGKEIWLDAVPKYVEDRANYQRATIFLGEKEMLPRGLQLVMPEGNRTSYKFESYTVNSLWKKIIRDFDLPPLPDGWDHVVEEPPSGQTGRPAPAGLQTLRVEPPRPRQRK